MKDKLGTSTMNPKGQTRFVLIAIAVSLIAAKHFAEAAKTIVIDWVIPPMEDSDNFYGTTIADVGDTINFQWTEYHNVFIHPSNGCSGKDAAIEVGASSQGGDVSYTFKAEDIGQVTFTCDVGNHCLFGQFMQVQVEGAEPEDTSSPTVSPTKAPTPPPTKATSSPALKRDIHIYLGLLISATVCMVSIL